MKQQQLTLEMLQKRTGKGRMDLSSLRLDQVPIELMCRCAGSQQISSVDLSDNLLTSVPSQLPRLFSNIRDLDLSSNKIKRLPDNFGVLANLRSLDLSCNQIKRLPNSFSELEELRWLNLADNPLERDLAEIVGNCADDEQCKKAAKSAVEYVHFSSTLSSESTAIADESNQFLETESASSASSSSQETTSTDNRIQRVGREDKRKLYRKQPSPKNGQLRQQQEQLRAEQHPDTRSFCSRICSSVTVFLCLVAFLFLTGIPIWLTIDSMRESCVSGSAILSRTVLSRHPEERRFCAQLAQSILNGTFPSPFGQFLSDFSATFRAHWTQAVMERIPPEMKQLKWWSDQLLFVFKFMAFLCWHIFGPIYYFIRDFFADIYSPGWSRSLQHGTANLADLENDEL